MDIISGHESYKNYQQQRQTMEDLLGRASGVIGTLNMGQHGENLKAMQNKIHDDSFKIMVVGTFKNGKSTFINSFLGEDILPAYSIPTTAVINEVKYGESKRAVLHFRNPLPEKLPNEIPQRTMAHMQQHGMTNIPPLEIPYDEIEDYVVIPMGEDPREMLLESPYEKVELFWPLELLKNGVEIIDSPGLNEHATRTKVTMDYLRRADAILMVLNAQALCAATEMDFIENDLQAQGFEDPFFVINRFDCIPKREQEMVKRFAERKLKEFTSFGVSGIHYVSALDALEGKQEGDRERYEGSGLPQFEKMLSDFLTRNKGKVKLAQPARELKRILNEEALYKVIPMQRKMLSTDLDTMKQRRDSIQPRLVNLQHQKSQLETKLMLRVEQSKPEFRRAASKNILDMMDSTPVWVEEFTPQTKIGVNFLKSKQRMNAMADEINDHIQTKIQEHQLTWRNDVLCPLVEEKVNSIFDSAEADVAAILSALDGIQMELSDGKAQIPQAPVWQRVLSVAGGLALGQWGLAISGGINGFSKEIAVSIAMDVGLCTLLNVFGLFNPLTAIAVVVAMFVRNIRSNESNITHKMKEAVVKNTLDALAASREETITAVVDSVARHFQGITGDICKALDAEIAEVNNQIHTAVSELEKGKLQVEAREAQLAACEDQIRKLSTELDELVFRLVEG